MNYDDTNSNIPDNMSTFEISNRDKKLEDGSLSLSKSTSQKPPVSSTMKRKAYHRGRTHI
jgi:hypothetical protein